MSNQSKQYFVYEEATGKILRNGYCHPRDFSLQAGVGEVVAEGTADDIRQQVDLTTGSVVSRPAAELQAEVEAKAGAKNKQLRRALLAETDWTQQQDCELTPQSIAEFRNYRRALRRVKKQKGYPLSVVFPKKPEKVYNDFNQ